MLTYFLCDDNETIYRIEMTLKQENKAYYLSLLENYLTELIFIEEKTVKKLVPKEEVDKENKESVNIEDSQIFLEKTKVINEEKIDDNLPFVVTIKTKKYLLPRTYTILTLICLLAKDLETIDNLLLAKINNLIDISCFINFNAIVRVFFDEIGNIVSERTIDFSSYHSLLKNLDLKIDEKYSRSYLSNFWQGGEMERETATSIVSKASLNKEALKKLNLKFNNLTS